MNPQARCYFYVPSFWGSQGLEPLRWWWVAMQPLQRWGSLRSYYLVMTNRLPWKKSPFLIAKPSISMGHLYHGELLNNQRVYMIWYTSHPVLWVIIFLVLRILFLSFGLHPSAQRKKIYKGPWFHMVSGRVWWLELSWFPDSPMISPFIGDFPILSRWNTTFQVILALGLTSATPLATACRLGCLRSWLEWHYPRLDTCGILRWREPGS